MKTISIRLLTASFALAAFAVASQAQAIDQIIVNVPYEFVVGGKTLPAGTYRVNRISTSSIGELSITGTENHAGVLLVSSDVASTNEDKPAVSFEKVGDQHFLSKIETAEHIFTIPVSSKSAPIVAKNQSSPSTSSSSGSN
jgi:hypothetical protein